MGVVSAGHQKQIEAAVAGGNPEAAFSILRGYADLRHADMPPVSKAALQAIAKDPAAVRVFVLGIASTSISVRRFCRKYLPKLGEPAAGWLLALAAESLDPFRPGDGLIGGFGGVVSPLARTILDEKMSFEIKANYAYSQAGRYAKEVMDDLVFVVGATSHDHLLRFCEYLWGSLRVAGLDDDATRDWPHADFIVPWTHQAVQETLSKDAARWGAAVVRWTAGRTLLLDETSADPVVIALARRVRERGMEAAAELRERLLSQYGTNFHGLSQEHRIALCRNLRDAIPTVAPKLRPYLERSVEDYRKKYPEEAEQAMRPMAPWFEDAAGATAPTPASPAVSAARSAPTSPAPASAGERTAAEASAGPGGERALSALLRVVFHVGLPRLHATIIPTLPEDLRDADVPKPGGSAEDEKILGALHEAIIRHRAPRPGSTSARPRWGEDKTYVPEHVLENAPFGLELADLLIRLIGPGSGFMLAAAAATLLSREGARRFGAAWALRAKVDTPLYDDYSNEILDALAERRFAPCVLLHSVYSREETEFELHVGEGWQRAIAMLYHWGGDPGREAALDLLALHPYPKDVGEYHNRRDFDDAHLSTMWAAWQRRDVEMLALAFERFAVPYYWRGAKAMLPSREPFFTRSGHAAASATADGVPLAEVWQLAASAGRSAATVRASLQHAELCEAPRTFLDLAAAEDFAGLGDEVLRLLESSNPAVLACGLAILSRVPAVAGERAGEAVTLAATALTSTRSGVAKEAAATLAALGDAHPAVRRQAFSALADGLAIEAAPVLQAILKNMKRLPGRLPGDARERIVELSRNDPAKFEKLAKPLLAA